MAGAPDHHRTGERAAADFIESSNKVIALGRKVRSKSSVGVIMRGSHRLTMVRIHMVQDSDGPELNQFKDSHGSKKLRNSSRKRQTRP